MCGIAGFVSLSNPGRIALAPDVLDALEHRGPDDSGWITMSGTTVRRGVEWKLPANSPEVLLLQRRLSILDVSKSGWQPMSTPDQRYHIIYNGEIYNYLELRRELEELGCTFHSNSDTEVLLYALAQWGTDGLKRMVGMFAFALLDTLHRTVTLGRDFFGIKPLFYWIDNGCLYFASEIKALVAFGLSRPSVNPSRLLLYLRYGVSDFGAETMLADVAQLPSAHTIQISLETGEVSEPKRFWTPIPTAIRDISFHDAARRVRELFLESVQLHLRSDVPVGVALSGGIDSSSIVMAIRHLHPNAEIHAFSFISEQAEYSEEKWVDIVARESGAILHKVHATASQMVSDLGLMVAAHGEPFGSTSAYAQFQVFRAAHNAGIKVMLDGQGADELLGGYDQYKGARLASLVRQSRWADAFSFLRQLGKSDAIGIYLGIAYSAEFLLPPALQTLARAAVGKQTFPSWLRAGWFRDRDVTSTFANFTDSPFVLRRCLARSLHETLPALLRYEDRNSMASSVESRVPFLTPQFVEFVSSLPEEYLIDAQGTSKAVFRQAMRGLVPDAILDRKDKIGFATPERSWLTQSNGWAKSALRGATARQMPFLNIEKAQDEFDAVTLGKRPFNFHLWRWINLIQWSEDLQVQFV